MVCAICAAAALAKLTGGMVREEDEGALMDADRAAHYAVQHVESTLKTSVKRLGTRPSDFKRYLKPLLDLRPDLVLTGRLLFVRPVRHILRGALFEPSMFKGHFYLWRFMTPLYAPSRGNVFDDRI